MNDFMNNRASSYNSSNGGGFIVTIRTIEMFADNVKMVMENYFGDSYSVAVQKVNKNNGVVLKGLLIMDNKTNVVPTIYLDGEKMADLCKEIVEVYQENKVHVDFATYIMFHDLAVIFYVLVSQDTDTMAVVTVKKSFQKMWGIEEESLFSIALQNTQRLFKGKVTSIAETMNEIQTSSVGEESASQFYDMVAGTDDMIPMYVATNHMKLDGAGVIFYENILKDFADKVGSDFYIIPSSVHEVLFVPVSAGFEPAFVKDMVVNVNATELVPEEVLSDNVYYYSRVLDRVEMM